MGAEPRALGHNVSRYGAWLPKRSRLILGSGSGSGRDLGDPVRVRHRRHQLLAAPSLAFLPLHIQGPVQPALAPRAAVKPAGVTCSEGGPTRSAATRRSAKSWQTARQMRPLVHARFHDWHENSVQEKKAQSRRAHKENERRPPPTTCYSDDRPRRFRVVNGPTPPARSRESSNTTGTCRNRAVAAKPLSKVTMCVPAASENPTR